MQNEKLIEAVRNYRVLYDLNNPIYHDNRHKDNIWNMIGKSMGQPGKVCKKRWNNIRDNFRKARRKSNNCKTGLKVYKFEEQLQFLIPFFQDRDRVKDELDEELDLDYQEANNDEELDTMENDHLNEESIGSAHPEESSSSFALLKYLLTQKENIPKKRDGVDSFLSAIGDTLKTFDSYTLNQAKSKIFAVVQEMELKMIVEQGKSPVKQEINIEEEPLGELSPKVEVLTEDFNT